MLGAGEEGALATLAQDGVPRDLAEVYQRFFTVHSLFVVAACALLVWVSWQSYRQHRLAFLKLWAASWMSYLLARLLTLMETGLLGDHLTGPLRTTCSALSQTGFYVHVWLLVICLRSLAGHREARLGRRRLLLVLGGIFAFAGGLTLATSGSGRELRVMLQVGLRCAVTAAAFAACGVLLVRHGHRIRRLGAQFVGVTLLFGATSYGLHAYAFSFDTVFEFSPYLGSFEILVVCAIGLGLVLWMQEDVNEQARQINHELGERTSALLQAQRLESIGQLAGGVAHDFNNVLTVVIGNTESLLRQRDLPNRVRTSLEETHHAAMQAAKMTGQLLTLARNPASAVRAIDIGREVHEILPLLRSLVGARIRIVVATADPPLRVLLKRGHVEQVLINLVTNARDAIPDTGTVRIIVEREMVDGGSRIVLSAVDSGTGMPESVQRRVGELFFTTKGGSGTGMGMASVRSILAETEGRMRVESKKGGGTTVTVSWPEVDSKPEGASEPAVVQLPRPPGATILFAEDDAMVRNVTRRTLEGAGFRVLVEEDSTNAARVARDHEGTIDLLLSDVVMPGLSGPELAQAVRDVRPGIKVRFISGYIDAEHSAKLPDMAPVLGKPFTRQELLAFVQSALSDHSDQASEVTV